MHASDPNVTPSRSVLSRLLIRSWEYRQPYVFGGVRLLVGVWLIVLGAILCGSGYWWGALLIAVAVLTFWLAYYILRTVRG